MQLESVNTGEAVNGVPNIAKTTSLLTLWGRPKSTHSAEYPRGGHRLPWRVAIIRT